MKRLFLIIILLAWIFSGYGQNLRQRNMIYVLDCTASMDGYGGAPKVWSKTKNYLKTELEKAVKENPNVRITLIPFQGKALNPIKVNSKNIEWESLDNRLNSFLKNITGTNICDAWLKAEEFVDESCENFIILMTDGQDNVRGVARLEGVFNEFCGKFKNTKGVYVELSSQAALHPQIKNSIDWCRDIYTIRLDESFNRRFGSIIKNQVVVNTRDLPKEIQLGFSSYENYKVENVKTDNPYVNISIKGNEIKNGKFVLCVDSKFDKNVEALNNAIGADLSNITLEICSDSVIILNPEIDLILKATPLRTFEIDDSINSIIDRVTPFLWIKGNVEDTLKWNLKPVYNAEAVKDRSFVQYKIKTDSIVENCNLLFDGNKVGTNGEIIIKPESKGLLELIVPQSVNDNKIVLSLNEISSYNVDRINGQSNEFNKIELYGQCKSHLSIIEIIILGLCSLFIAFLVLWFAFLRNRIYPKFKRGIIIINSPYYATIRVKGVRMVVFTSVKKSQSWVAKLWKGKVLYHINEAWSSEVEITPSSKNMRFRCPSGRIISQPSPLWQRMEDYELIDTLNNKEKIKININ